MHHKGPFMNLFLVDPISYRKLLNLISNIYITIKMDTRDTKIANTSADPYPLFFVSIEFMKQGHDRKISIRLSVRISEKWISIISLLTRADRHSFRIIQHFRAMSLQKQKHTTVGKSPPRHTLISQCPTTKLHCVTSQKKASSPQQDSNSRSQCVNAQISGEAQQSALSRWTCASLQSYLPRGQHKSTTNNARVKKNTR